MLIRLLGPVDALGDTGEVTIAGERRRSVLATLALRPGELVSVDRLVDAVWGDLPPLTARNGVQVHVAYLRRVLGKPEVIRTSGPGYVLSLPSPGTDVVIVNDLLARAAVAPGPAERIPLLEEAVSHWRSTALGGVGDCAYLARHAVVLDELRVATLERVLADHLRQGSHHQVLGRISTLVAEQPDRDRPTQLLMTALYRLGRPRDALAAYRRLEAAQREMLGAQPSPALQALYRRIEAGDPKLHLPIRTARPLRRPAVEATVALRRPVSRLIGREDKVARVEAMLDRGRLVTIVGMGGVGKTALAMEVARRRAGTQRVDVVDLTSATDHPQEIAQLVASVLLARPEDGQSTFDAVSSALRGTRGVLVVDNCEHVAGAAATFLARLLGDAPDLVALATSREPLHLEGEECLLLAPLAVGPGAGEGPSPAVAMLLDRASAADPAFAPSEADLLVLEEICRRVDGLPLALEIIGPRLRSLTAQELAEGIGNRLFAWRDQRRHTTERHRSIGSLMEWSYGLLDEAEAAALDQLSVLRGGGWLVEVADLCGRHGQSGEDVLLALIDRSLVERSELEGRSRVSLHPLVRSYAAGRLRAADAADRAAERHAVWVEKLLEADRAFWHGPDEARRLRWRTLDAANVGAALQWRSDHAAQQLTTMVSSSWWWWYRTGEAKAGYAWATKSLAALGQEGKDTARLNLAAGYLAWVVDDYEASRHAAASALRSAGSDPEVAGFAQGILARVFGDEGDFEEAIVQAQASISSYQRADDAWGVAWSQRCLAGALRYAGRFEEANAACNGALATFRRLGDVWGLAGTLTTAASVREATGELDAARKMGAEAVAAHRAIDDASGQRRALQQLAQICWALGAVDDAATYAAESLALSEKHGYLVGALQALLLLEDIAGQSGHDLEACALSERAADLATRLGTGADLSLMLARRRRAQDPAWSEAGGNSASSTT